MKRKTAYGIFIAAFFILCLIPSAGMLLFGESEAAANEILSPRPVIFQEDGSFNQNFTDDLTSYIADRFAFRQEFITAYAKIQAVLFQESSSEDVVLGKDGWLFYQDTVDDYLHHDTLSDRQIQGIARTLSLMQQYAEERGVRFVFTVAPNKNSLYPEYMPDVGDVFSGEKNLDMLEDLLDDYGIRYADLRETFEDQPVLYYREDSHWNSRGAALGLACITEQLDVEAYPWFDEPYRMEANHKGDLYEMLYPAGKELEEDTVFDRKFEFSYRDSRTGETMSADYYSEDAPAPDSIRIDTFRDGGTGSLLMFRDSFGNSLYPFMADTFENSTFSRLMPYRMDWLDAGAYDHVVVEIVERNLKNLAQQAPVMAAPEVSLNNDVTDGENISASAEISASRDLAGYCMISGVYDSAGVDEDTGVYICFEGESTGADPENAGTGGGSAVYEAFPVGSGISEQQTDACFTAYIPEEVLNGSEFSVILSKNGTLCRVPCEQVRK